MWRGLAEPPLAFETLPSQVDAGAPLELLFTVLPAEAGQRLNPPSQLSVGFKSNGRERGAVHAYPDAPPDPATGAQRFRARMPALAPGEVAEYAPVVRRSGQVVDTLPVRLTRGAAAPTPADVAAASLHAPLAAAPRYEWASEFLGAFTVQLVDPPESFGPCPEGLRSTYTIRSGEVRGPKLNGKVRGGDWMVLRHDGVGVADTRVTFETDDGALLLSRYSGYLDFGPNGYQRALRNDFDPAPPLVLAPQFITSHPNWLWLNRLQCLAVGRANMQDLTVRLDIYAIRAGQPLPSSGLPRVGG